MNTKDETKEATPDPQAENFFQEGEANEPLSEEEKIALVGNLKKREKNPVLALLVIVLGIFVMISFSDDLIYFFQSKEPVFVGDFSADFAFDKSFPVNKYVSLKGVPDPRRAVSEKGDTTFEYFLIMGSWIFVQREKDEKADDAYDLYECSGRLVLMKDKGRYQKLRMFLESQLRLNMEGKKTYLLIQDKKPRDEWFVPLVYLLLLSIFIVNIISLTGYVKRKIGKRSA